MDLYGIALSGMQAAQTQINAAAQNIANLDTPGYTAIRPDLVELSTGGVAVSGVSQDPTPGPALPNGQRGPNVDLANEMINLTRSQLLYSANAAVLRVGQKMTGSLLDILDNQNHDANSD